MASLRATVQTLQGRATATATAAAAAAATATPPACPKIDPSKNQNVAVTANEPQLIFDGRIRMRLHTSSSGAATFYSNVPLIEVSIYLEGSGQRFVIDNCTYVLKIMSVYDFSVYVSFFQV